MIAIAAETSGEILDASHRRRSSTILGFVGAGGLGIYLRMTIQVLEFEQALGIIALVIVLVILSELLSHHVRSWYQ